MLSETLGYYKLGTHCPKFSQEGGKKLKESGSVTKKNLWVLEGWSPQAIEEVSTWQCSLVVKTELLVPILWFTTCVISDKLLHPSGPWFPHWKVRMRTVPTSSLIVRSQ